MRSRRRCSNGSGNSYGISNGDGTINWADGGSVCWFKAKPMPENFRLYQTIPAEKPSVVDDGSSICGQERSIIVPKSKTSIACPIPLKA